MQRRTELQVGITVLVAVAALLWGMAWLKEFTLTANTRTYRVTFPQAGGLSASDEVQVNGIRKGSVNAMRLAGDHVEVDLVLSKDIVLTTDSRVSIRNIGMMGEKVIAVDLRTTGRPYGPGDVIAGNYELGLGEVMGQMGTTIEAVAELSQQLNRVAEALTRDGKLANTLHNFNETSEELRLVVRENRATLKSTLDNFAAASKTARTLTTDREAELGRAMDRFASAAERLDRLSGRLDSLRAVVQSLAGKVDRGEGTLGRLVNDEKLYTDLNGSIQSLKSLIEDVRANPKKYLKVSIF